MATTFHTYPDLLSTGGRLAASHYRLTTPREAVAATLRQDAEAIILQAYDEIGGRLVGLAPGGLAA
jgi:hypothetical protein